MMTCCESGCAIWFEEECIGGIVGNRQKKYFLCESKNGNNEVGKTACRWERNLGARDVVGGGRDGRG